MQHTTPELHTSDEGRDAGGRVDRETAGVDRDEERIELFLCHGSPLGALPCSEVASIAAFVIEKFPMEVALLAGVPTRGSVASNFGGAGGVRSDGLDTLTHSEEGEGQDDPDGDEGNEKR